MAEEVEELSTEHVRLLASLGLRHESLVDQRDDVAEEVVGHCVGVDQPFEGKATAG